MKKQDLSLSSLKTTIVKWLDSITMHGVPNIFNHDMSILKVMWLISFLASAGAFAYMTFVTVRQYLVYEVVTKIDTIDETSIRFPKITICSANPFVTDAGLKFVESVLKANRIDDLTNSDILSEAYPAASMSQISMNFASALNLAQTAAYDTNITDSARQSFGLTFDQMFVSCTFALNECTPDHWVWYYDPQFGNCYNFNSGSFVNKTKYTPLSSTVSGTKGGLSLELYVPTNKDPNSLSISSGAEVFINPNSVYVNSARGPRVSPGFITYIAIDKTISSSLPRPYSECVQITNSTDGHDSLIFKLLVEAGFTYTQESCNNLYIQLKVVEMCGCFSTITMNVNASVRACSSIDDNQCYLQTTEELIQSNYKASTHELCPLQCDITVFEYFATTATYPTAAYGANLLKEPKVKTMLNGTSNVTLAQIRENFLSVNIYFRFIRYTSITEAPSVPTELLVANIGGNLALFLGMSILSFIEFIDLAFQLAYTALMIAVQKMRNAKTKKANEAKPEPVQSPNQINLEISPPHTTEDIKLDF